MRYIEHDIIIGDAPSGIITDLIRETANLGIIEGEDDESPIEESQVNESFKDSMWREGVIHRLSKETYFWNFSLVYKEGNFDIIKWKSASAWKQKKSEDEELIMEKALFIGASGGVFFILIDEDIDENFTPLADMMDVFLEKTKKQAPFIVFAVLENKQKIAELKSDPKLLRDLADVKKWAVQNGGEFRLENLAEIKMNINYLINDYAHFLLLKLGLYPKLKTSEVHFLDYEDLSALKEIEAALAEQAKVGETIDALLSEMVFARLKSATYQEEADFVPKVEAEPETEVKVEPVIEVAPEAPTMKEILREIRLGIRRQCPQCFNKERNKIREVTDYDNIIMENPNIYGFKYVCGMCGNEWRTQKYEWKDEE